jgi:flagellar biosynthesis/type III secretory pathway chaperone
MTSVLETLTLKELYTRKKNLIFQLEKVDEEIKKKLENEPDIHIEISPYLNKDIDELGKKIVIRKSINNGIQTSLNNFE